MIGAPDEAVTPLVPGLVTGAPCAVTEQFSEPFVVGDRTFQTWWCTCGSGVNAQVAPENLLPRFAREHLAHRT